MKKEKLHFVVDYFVILFPFLIFIFALSFKWEGKYIFMSFHEISWRYKQISFLIIIGSIILLLSKRYRMREKIHWFVLSAYLIGVFFIPYSNMLRTRYADIFWFLVPNDFLPKLNHFLIFPVDKFFLAVFIIEISFIVMLMLLAKDSIDIVFDFTFTSFFLYFCLAVPIEFLVGKYKIDGIRVIYSLKIFFLIYPIFSAAMFFLLIKKKGNIIKAIVVLLHILGSFLTVFYENINHWERLVNCFSYFIERYILLSNTVYLLVIALVVNYLIGRNIKSLSCRSPLIKRD